MANTATLAVKIVSDSSAARADIGKSSNAVSKWGDRATKVGKIAGRALAGGLLAAGAAAVKFTQAAAEDASSAQKLADAVKQATGATDDQVKSLESWIEAQGKALGVADDELRPALSRFVTVTKDVGAAQRLASLAMNISARTGKSLKSVTEGLAKAQTGSITGLAKFGVQVKNAAGETKSLDRVMLDLTKTYAGSASKAANTAAGRQKRLTVAMDELQEKIGAKLLPVMEKLIDVGFKVIDWIDKNQKLVGTLIVGIGGLLAAIWAITKVMKVWAAIWAVVSVAIGVHAAITGVDTAAIAGNTIAVKAHAVATKLAAAAQWVFNAAMSANPIALVVIAIIALIAAVVIAYKKSDSFRALVQKVGAAGAAAFTWVLDKLDPLIDAFVVAAKWLGSKLPAAWQTMKTLAVRYIELVTAPWRTLFGMIQDVYGWLKDKVPAAFNTVKDAAQRIASALTAPFRALAGFIQTVIDKAQTAIAVAKQAAALARGDSVTGTKGGTHSIPSSPRIAPSTTLTERRTQETINIRVDGSIVGTTDEKVGNELLGAINRGRRTMGLPPLG